LERIKDILDPAALLETIAGRSNDAIAIKDLDLRYLFANQRFADLNGLANKRLIGCTDVDAGVDIKNYQSSCTTSEALDKLALSNSSCEPETDSAYPLGTRLQWLDGQRVVTSRSKSHAAASNSPATPTLNWNSRQELYSRL